MHYWTGQLITAAWRSAAALAGVQQCPPTPGHRRGAQVLCAGQAHSAGTGVRRPERGAAHTRPQEKTAKNSGAAPATRAVQAAIAVIKGRPRARKGIENTSAACASAVESRECSRVAAERNKRLTHAGCCRSGSKSGTVRGSVWSGSLLRQTVLRWRTVRGSPEIKALAEVRRRRAGGHRRPCISWSGTAVVKAWRVVLWPAAGARMQPGVVPAAPRRPGGPAGAARPGPRWGAAPCLRRGGPAACAQGASVAAAHPQQVLQHLLFRHHLHVRTGGRGGRGCGVAGSAAAPPTAPFLRPDSRSRPRAARRQHPPSCPSAC